MIRIALCFLILLPLSSAEAADRRVILVTIDGFPARMFADPKTHAPNLRALAREGVAAEGMKVSTPSVTWPNHTTLVTGAHPRKHSVLFNGVVARGAAGAPLRIDPNVTAAQLVAVPSLFDALRAAGLRTAGVNWPCTRSSKSIDDDFPDSPNMVTFMTPGLRTELVAEGILGSEKQEWFAALRQPQNDAVWTKTACHLIGKRQPHFMAFHLLNTDSTHHKYGPETMASHTALALADRFVGDVMAAVREAGNWERTAFIVTSDHGFETVTNVLQPNVLLRRHGLLEISSLNLITRARVQCIPEGGSGFIYLNDPATRDADRQRVTELFAKEEGVAEIIGPERFQEMGLPEAGQGGMADLILRPRDGYGVNGAAAGTNFVIAVTAGMNAGYHGYVAENPRMNALFIASGSGLKKGERLGLIENIDVAPTVAKLLGVKLPEADGKALVEILEGK